MRDHYYPAWNQLIADEPVKFVLHSMIYRGGVSVDLSVVSTLNAATSIDLIEAIISPNYTLSEIQQFVSTYAVEYEMGIGLVLITECMNKTTDLAYYNVVFFNMQRKEVLLHERLKGDAGGFGLRNYWASSYEDVMNAIREDRYYKWQKEYATKCGNAKNKAK